MTWKKYEFTDAKWAEMKAKIQKTFPDIEGGELTGVRPRKGYGRGGNWQALHGVGHQRRGYASLHKASREAFG
jgi:hypothetical protein